MRSTFWPRINSLQQLAFIAIALAILPLVAALVTSTLYVNRISTQGQEAIHQATLVANASQLLSDSLIAMERNARQYNILLDEELFNLYLEHRESFNRSMNVLSGLHQVEKMSVPLEEIQQAEAKIYQGLQTVLLGSEQSALLLSGFTGVNEKVKIIRDESSRLKTLAVERLQQSANKAKTIMVWQLAALLPVLVFVVYLFALVILRPIRHLDAAIRRLGRGELDSPIEISGPNDLKELGGSLEWTRQKINELESQKTRFLQHISHELKTPLTSLREGSNLLYEGVVGELTPEQKEIALLLKHNCYRLQEQIENLLRFSVAQSNEYVLNTSKFALDDLVSEVLIDHQLAIKNKNLSLVVNLECGAVHADREKLRTVIDNLLSNAVKYSPPGGRLTITAEKNNGRIVFEVHDEGPGIPHQEKDQIFEPFYQGSIAPQSAVKGSGIGLSVCQAYVLSHGGEIYVKPVDKGAKLCVEIPDKIASGH